MVPWICLTLAYITVYHNSHGANNLLNLGIHHCISYTQWASFPSVNTSLMSVMPLSVMMCTNTCFQLFVASAYKLCFAMSYSSMLPVDGKHAHIAQRKLDTDRRGWMHHITVHWLCVRDTFIPMYPYNLSQGNLFEGDEWFEMLWRCFRLRWFLFGMLGSSFSVVLFQVQAAL